MVQSIPLIKKKKPKKITYMFIFGEKITNMLNLIL